jgi:hypothetical protein
LGGFVAAAKQGHNRATPHEIDAVSRSIVDPHFAYAVANRGDVAGIALRKSVDPDPYFRSRPNVT